MVTKKITYTDYNGVERTEDFYFNLTKPEILKMQESVKGGYDVQLKGIANTLDGKQIIEFFEELIYRSYGEKSADGRRLMKSEEITKNFMETPAYEVFFEELVTNDNAASDFINALFSEKVRKELAAAKA